MQAHNSMMNYLRARIFYPFHYIFTPLLNVLSLTFIAFLRAICLYNACPNPNCALRQAFDHISALVFVSWQCGIVIG